MMAGSGEKAWGVALLGSLVVVDLVLGGAALVKYRFAKAPSLSR